MLREGAGMLGANPIIAQSLNLVRSLARLSIQSGERTSKAQKKRRPRGKGRLSQGTV